MMEQTRVLHGLRPKVKSSTDLDSAVGQRHKSVPRSSYPKANPLQSLSHMLLPWMFENEEVRPKPVKGVQEFNNINDYIEHWLPLTLKEIKAGIISSIQSTLAQIPASAAVPWSEFQISGDIIVDSGEISSQASNPSSEMSFLKGCELGMTNSKLIVSNRRNDLSSMDVVLLSLQPITERELRLLIEGKPAPSKPIFALGLITSSSRVDGLLVYNITMYSKHWERFLKLKSSSSSSSSTSSGPGKDKLNARSAAASSASMTLHLFYADSLISSWREFYAVNSLSNHPPSVLQNQLLGQSIPMIMPSTPPSSPSTSRNTPPVSSTDSGASVEISRVISKHLGLNASQQDAVLLGSNLNNEGFSLVQGPPGTGKTTTLIGIVNAIHLGIYNKFYAAVLEAALGRPGLLCRQQIAVSNDAVGPWISLYNTVLASKDRLIITAPSNIAVDNIVTRVVQRGFIDGSGNIYKPSVVRVGVGRASSSSSGMQASASSVVSLEETVEREIMSELSTVEGKAATERIQRTMLAIATELFATHSYLLTLKDVFKAHPLPPGVELRVELGSGQPYWVDHNTRSTSNTPPSAPSPHYTSENGSVSVRYLHVHTLPEYLIHSKALTRLLGDLYKSHLSLTRLQARLHGTRFGPSDRDRGDNREGRSSLLRESRIAIEASILESCDIICTTLNSAGHQSLSGLKFQICVVDEAAQATEPSVLIALGSQCRHCVLIGDCNQLPATVLSNSAKSQGLDISLFERLLKAKHPFILLNQQYRMHPQISRFPSNMFYDGRVLDGPNVTEPTYGLSLLKPMIAPALPEPGFSSAAASLASGPHLRPCMFFNLCDSQDSKQLVSAATATAATNMSLSVANVAEATLCVELLRDIVQETQRWGCWQWERSATGEEICFAEALTVGVISPYTEQVAEVRKQLRQAELPSTLHFPGRGHQSAQMVSVPLEIDVNTVDGFQGREKDIIIFSCVRANDVGSIGFLSDYRRLNVALTRARFGLLVVGHAKTLIGSVMWRSFIEYAQSIGTAIDVHPHHSAPRYAVLDHFRARGITQLEPPGGDSQRKRKRELDSAAFIAEELEEGEIEGDS